MEEKTILIIDDDSVAVDLLHAVLSNEFNCETAYSGAEAIDKLKKIDIHLIVSDLSMPNIDGLDILLRLKEDDSEIPMIFVTAHTEREMQELALKKGAKKYLTKPVDVDKLYKTIYEVFDE